MTIDKTSRLIGYWLLLGAILVILMVVIGGITRLTHSGLSLVTWKPIAGTIPPMNEVEWHNEFSNYKSSPEFKIKNFDFTLQEFKSIFWWEYIHRLLGRIIGIIFIIPFLYFLFTKKLKENGLIYKTYIILLLGAFQGILGWLMVKSGLVDIPSVSHYRLSFHLITALILVSYILWTAMVVLLPNSKYARPHIIKKWLNILLFLLALQLFYGGLVAGLKGGLFYPTFPKMGDVWIPDKVITAMQTFDIISFFEDPIVVQFIHRILAYIISLIVFYLLIKVRNRRVFKAQRYAFFSLGILICIQFTLGIYTLLLTVPVILGVLHQFVAVLFLCNVIVLMYLFRSEKPGSHVEI